MSEAKDDSTQKPKPVTMTFNEINSLVARLLARSHSVLMKDQPSQAADLAQAAAVIRAMAKHFNQSDVLQIENST